MPEDQLRYAHLLELALTSPWAILPEKLTVIARLLADRAAGIERTPNEIAAAVADRRPKAPQGTGAIAVMPIYGTIIPRATLFSSFSGGTSAQEIASGISAAAANPAISAIVLDIDSPGGNTQGITEAAAAIHQATQSKPVYASINGYGTSAAYWLASQATELLGSPSSMLGSIGVIAIHEDITAALEQKGISVQLITAGDYKHEGMLGPLEGEALAHTQSLIDDVYGVMVADIARGRGISKDTVLAQYGQGRYFPAREALGRGMLDGIETLDALLTRLTSRTQGSRTAGRAESEPLVAALGERLRVDALAHALGAALRTA